jgi:type III secretion system (T3SS) SseB-like protein
MAFTPNNDLEKHLVAATHNPAARADFYRALTAAEVFIISETPKPGADGTIVADGKMQVKIQLVDVAGKPHVPIFSSKERISAIVKTEVPFIAMNGRAALLMLREADVVMNPGAEYGKLFTKEEIASILDGTVFAMGATQNVAGQKVLLSQPKDYPNHIADALRQFFPKSAQVKRVYLAQAQFQQLGHGPHTLIGVDMTGDWRAVVSEAGAVAQSVARPGEVIDFMQISDRPDDDVSKYLRSTTPMYELAK